jgi:redox-sensitive bicupin YhaK (pirin superfamily)
VHLRRAFGFGQNGGLRPVPPAWTTSATTSRGLPRGLPLAPAPRHRDDHVRARGNVEHADSLGNRGTIGAGDIQWMTAGSGIIHQEMPTGRPAGPHARLPALGEPPERAEDDEAALPRGEGEGHPDDRGRRRHRGAPRLRRVLGEARARRGDRRRSDYIDVSVRRGSASRCPSRRDAHAFAYVFGGSGKFCNASEPLAVPTEGVGWWEHDTPPAEWTTVAGALRPRRRGPWSQRTARTAFRFLLCSGQPLREPVAWYDPIVMNTPGRAPDRVPRAGGGDVPGEVSMPFLVATVVRCGQHLSRTSAGCRTISPFRCKP